MRLYQIEEEVRRRTEAIAASHANWPCRRGCDDCCRNLAAPPRVSRQEWLRMEAAIGALPPEIARSVRRRIRELEGAQRPLVCPLLDLDSGNCLIYDARPIACRAYGFYAERGKVLGCSRIESLAAQEPEIVWGNHEALEDRLRSVGQAETCPTPKTIPPW